MTSFAKSKKGKKKATKADIQISHSRDLASSYSMEFLDT
jgi:hypothetical protein